ncbi:DedA family protein [Baekduia soli]|uniref:DedA family protein n=1 Tax=Baekduia soli TaxID=496014 RepID=A0A5B8U7V7_9ACTN|nr:DedA family protein [Baekduia soli]QEC49037.1 DedA family protein [Baekduia soli]
MHPFVLASLTGTLTDWIGHHGAYAVFVIMAIDAVFPAGGELTMLYAGALAAGAVSDRHAILFGHVLHSGLEAYLVLAAVGTAGYLAGALIGWGVGRFGGRPLLERHGRWLHLGPDNLARAEHWFARHGRAAVLWGRLTPVVRSFISIPAGALESPPASYAVLTLIGSAIWCFAFAGAGWALGSSYDQVHHAFTGVEVAVVALAVLAAGLLVHRRRRAAPST